MNIIPVNRTDSNHTIAVAHDMQVMGIATIKAVWMECWDTWVALEGSHRIAAANVLGMPIEISEIEYDDTLVGDIGIEDADCTVEEWADGAFHQADLMVEVRII